MVSEIVWDNLTITQADSSPNPINNVSFKGNGVFTWPENTSIDQRTATIRCDARNLAASGLNANSDISTIQQGKQPERLEVVPDSLEFNAEGGTQTLQITSNTSWSIQ